MFRSLIFGDQLFYTDVFLHGMMTVQMVLCDVEDRTYLRVELVNSLQLKAADLRNSYGILPHLQ